MKTIFTIILAGLFSFGTFAHNDPWKKEQMMPVKELAERITSKKDVPVILNIGPMENIKTAITVGPMNSIFAKDKIQNALSGTDKNREIVVYCGCCSYANCPNIRPAFEKVQELGYKKVKVLEIPEGIKPDWVAKGYPME
jgi:thiosulfate/3-mercaptopyruvate sulfurtransferase